MKKHINQTWRAEFVRLGFAGLLLLGVLSFSHSAFAKKAPEIKAAITAQIVNVDSKKPTLVELTTVVPHPYYLVAVNFSFSSKISIKLLSFRQTKKTIILKSKYHKQRFTALLKPIKACRLDGVYWAHFRFKCKTSKGCKYRSTVQHKIKLTLKSENFCKAKTVESDKK